MPARVRKDSVTLEENSSPTTPAAGQRLIYPKTGGRWAYKLDDGTEIEMGNAPYRTALDTQNSHQPQWELPLGNLENPSARIARINAVPSPDAAKLTIVNGISTTLGAFCVTSSATSIGSGSLSNGNDTDSGYASLDAASGAGNGSQINNLVNQMASMDKIEFGAIVRTAAAITTMRVFVGLFGSVGLLSADVPATTPYIAFRYSAGVDATHWQPVAHNGTTGSTGTVISTPTFAVSTRYFLKFRRDGSTVYFSINGGSEQAESSLNLPSISASQSLSMVCVVFTTAAVARSFKISRMWTIYP